MNVAEWIIVAILAMTLLVFLIVGIVLIFKLIDLTNEAKEVVAESKDIARNTNGIVANVKGMTSIGGTVEMFVEKYVNPKLKSKIDEVKEKKSAKAGEKGSSEKSGAKKESNK